MYVRDILQCKDAYVATVAPSAPLVDALDVLQFENTGALVVSEDGVVPQGILSDKDIVRGLCQYGRDVFALEAGDLMTRQLFICRPGDTAELAKSLMVKHRVSQLPVVDAGRLAGMIDLYDLHRFVTAPSVIEIPGLGDAQRPTGGAALFAKRTRGPQLTS